MPKNEKGEVKCLNNPQHEMTISGEYNALTGLKKAQDGSYNFLVDRGIPIIAHVCKNCGYVEIYHQKP